MAAQEQTLNELFLHTLKDIYSAEKQIEKSLTEMAGAAQTDELKTAFTKHKDETAGQIQRIEKVFDLCGQKPQAVTCEAMAGILAEGKEIMGKYKGTEALDPGILAAAQTVEHYEISRYGTLCAWAQELGMKDAASLLKETLEEEKKTDTLLTKIAESRVNKKAA